MNEENIKLLLVTLEMSIRNLKPKDVKQSHLDGLRKAIEMAFQDKSIEDVCSILNEYNVPVLRLPKGSEKICD